MELQRFANVHPFYEQTGRYLLAYEAHHNLLLGIYARLMEQPSYSEQPPYFVLVRHGREIVAAAPVIAARPVSGRVRPVTADDRALMVDWLHAFSIEALGDNDYERSVRNVDLRLESTAVSNFLGRTSGRSRSPEHFVGRRTGRESDRSTPRPRGAVLIHATRAYRGRRKRGPARRTGHRRRAVQEMTGHAGVATTIYSLPARQTQIDSG